MLVSINIISIYSAAKKIGIIWDFSHVSPGQFLFHFWIFSFSTEWSPHTDPLLDYILAKLVTMPG